MPQDRTGNVQVCSPHHAIAFPSVGKEEVLDSHTDLDLYVFLIGRCFDPMLAAGVVLPDNVHKGRGQLRSLTHLS